MTTAWHVDRIVGVLPDSTLIDVSQLLADATHHDGVRPLSEHASLHLRYGGDAAITHLLVRDRGVLVGYLHLDTTDAVEGPSAEVVVSPHVRKHGVASALLSAATTESRERDLRLWAHGDSADAAAFAHARGFEPARRLLQLRKSLYAPLPKPLLPEHITVRGFRVGEDEDAWLALNAEAFANLPDQGRWTRRDLDVRLSEPWFDSAGLLVAVDESGQLIGTHWTKTHGAVNHADHVHDPTGEVYVLGVADAARGTGLGRALTLLGLEHLRDQGLSSAMLYVDESNSPAIAVYEGLGFTRWDSDVLYRRTSPQ